MHVKTIPTPQELLSAYPLSEKNRHFIDQARKTTQSILDGSDQRLLLIVGPCSIHDIESTMEYAEKFKQLSLEVSDQFFLVMRAYLEKPRTHLGWKGFLSDPYLNSTHDIGAGLHLSRKLLLEFTKMEIPLGCELLDLMTHHFIADLLSWACIGARTTTSQPHRLLAASLPIPVGFKNTTDGNLDNPVNAMLVAEAAHAYLGLNSSGQLTKIEAKGNSHCHVILRGQERKPNYDPESILTVKEKLNKAQLNKKIIIDCSHDNCSKIYHRQITAFEATIDQILNGSQVIAGAMLESHLFSGSQPIPKNLYDLEYGVSVTDPCLGWDETQAIIKEAYCKLSNSTVTSS